MAYLVGPGIRFNDFLFSEPMPLSAWAPPKFPGIFVLLAADTNWAPRPFQPLYFGEFGNNARPLADHPIRASGPLFVSVLAMPFSSSTQRAEARNHLIWAYNPICQTTARSENELVRKLDELEKKHEEQTTQFQLLLASLNRLFEPQPEPVRRPIGFLPQTAD